ncbi:hypothetical protein [Marinobacter zhanjiangensis]|uniref:Uncharacterized protein n=1 Tax=Marinobacter zhanjiangensis TaxID=578215 RepID=A0ABQ3AKP6_9GAMM|nr:hypothetical protein [Marinobacter zhanjiangensis]GGY58693.1 hypothetical protein GCM10007071_01040 [Marinobacter zhanjiangensis]
MKRVLLVLLVAAVAGVFYANYRITSEVEERLEVSKMGLSMFGEFSWGDVSVSPLGALSITDIRFSPHGLPEAYRVDDIRFETAHLFELYNIAFQLDQLEIPDEMHMVVSGLRLDMDSNLFRELEAEASGRGSLMSRLVTAGCGDRDYFSVDDYLDMGYGVSVSDMTVGYRMSHSGTRMNLDLDLVSRGMMQVDTDMAVDLNPTAALNASTVSDASISRVRVAITDTGLNDRRNAFCADEAGVARATYPEYHQQAWMREWNREGLEPNETLVHAYRSFTSGASDTLILAIDPYPNLDANDRAMSLDPTYLSGRLSPSVAVAGADPQPFSVTSVEPVVEQVTEEASQEEDAPDTAPRDISGSLHQHINRDVRLTLTDGQRLDGRIKSIGNGRVQFNRRLHGGTMVVPIPLAQIKQARLAGE